MNADVWPKAGVCPKAGAAPNGLEEPKVEPAGVAVLVLPKILPPLDVVAVEDDPNIFVAVDPKAGLVSTLPKGLACCPKVEPDVPPNILPEGAAPLAPILRLPNPKPPVVDC